MNDMFFPLFCNGYVAQLCGEKAAIIFHQISYLIYNNQNDGICFYDGKFWMTKSLDAWANYYPNINRDQVFRALRKLEDAGLIESSNFNTESFNQTKWYSITENGWPYVNLKFQNQNSNIDIVKTQQVTVVKTQNVARANKVLSTVIQKESYNNARAEYFNDQIKADDVERIFQLHPRRQFLPQSANAIKAAVLREIDRGKSYEEAVALIENATRAYAEATSRWPNKERRFIVSSAKWFEQCGYLDDPQTWERDENSDTEDYYVAPDGSRWRKDSDGYYSPAEVSL